MVSCTFAVSAFVACVASLPYLLLPVIPIPVPETSAVLVTGASSGIGRGAAIAFACQGYSTFAGVRRLEDGDGVVADAIAQGCTGAVYPLLLDVTAHEDLSHAVATVTSVLQSAASGSSMSAKTLGVLVANAGVGALGFTETLPMPVVRQMFEVNVFGVLGTLRAFLPLLREHGPGARVVVVGSVVGWTSTVMNGLYSATKFAVRGMCDSLRQELAPFKISVTTIEPGTVETPMLDKVFGGVFPREATFGPISPQAHSVYNATQARFMVAATQAMSTPGMSSTVQDTDAAILHAATAARPPTRTAVGMDALALKLMAFLLPDSVQDTIFGLML